MQNYDKFSPQVLFENQKESKTTNYSKSKEVKIFALPELTNAQSKNKFC